MRDMYGARTGIAHIRKANMCIHIYLICSTNDEFPVE